MDSRQEDVAEVREDSRGEELSSVEYSVVEDEDVAVEVCHSATGVTVGGTSLLTALPFCSSSHSRLTMGEGVEPKVRVREDEAARCRSTSRGSLLELAEEEDLHGLQQSSSSSPGTLSSRGLRLPMPPLFIHRETSRAQAPRATAWADREPQSRWFDARD